MSCTKRSYIDDLVLIVASQVHAHVIIYYTGHLKFEYFSLAETHTFLCQKKNNLMDFFLFLFFN